MEEVAINPTIELPELTHDWETDSWRAQTEPCVHQNPGERSSDPTGEQPRLACECPGVSGAACVGGGLLRGWGTECSSASWDLLKEVTIIFIPSTIVGPR